MWSESGGYEALDVNQTTIIENAQADEKLYVKIQHYYTPDVLSIRTVR